MWGDGGDVGVVVMVMVVVVVVVVVVVDGGRDSSSNWANYKHKVEVIITIIMCP